MRKRGRVTCNRQESRILPLPSINPTSAFPTASSFSTAGNTKGSSSLPLFLHSTSASDQMRNFLARNHQPSSLPVKRRNTKMRTVRKTMRTTKTMKKMKTMTTVVKKRN